MLKNDIKIKYNITNQEQVYKLYSSLSSTFASSYFGSPRELRTDQLKGISSLSASSVYVGVRHIKDGFAFFNNSGMSFFEKDQPSNISRFLTQYSTGNLEKNQHILLKFPQDRKLSKIIEKSIIVSSRNTTNLYHYLSEVLPALEITLPYIDESYSISISSDMNDCHPSIAKNIFPNREILPYNGIFTLARIKDCYVVQSIPPRIYSKEIISNFVDKYNKVNLDNINIEPCFDFLYVKRGDSKGRKLINEDSLIKLLSQYPNKLAILNTDTTDFREQVNCFNNSKLVISTHGAQLTTSIFSKNIRGVIELWHCKAETPSSIIETMGIPNLQVITPEGDRNKKGKHRSDHYANLGNVKRAIDLLLSKK